MAVDRELALTQGKLLEAEELLGKSHAAQPSSNALLFLSTALWQQCKHAEAYGLLEDWLQQHPLDALILNQLGPLYLAQGRDRDAVGVF